MISRNISVISYLREPTHIGRHFGNVNVGRLLENQFVVEVESRISRKSVKNMADSTSPYNRKVWGMAVYLQVRGCVIKWCCSRHIFTYNYSIRTPSRVRSTTHVDNDQCSMNG